MMKWILGIVLSLVLIVPAWADVASDLAAAKVAHTAGDTSTRDALIANILATYQTEVYSNAVLNAAIFMVSREQARYADAGGMLDWMLLNGSATDEHIFYHHRSRSKKGLGDDVGANVDQMLHLARFNEASSDGAQHSYILKVVIHENLVSDPEAARVVMTTSLLTISNGIPFAGPDWRILASRYGSTTLWGLACGVPVETLVADRVQKQLDDDGRIDVVANTILVTQLNDGGAAKPLSLPPTLAADIGDISGRLYADVVAPAVTGGWDAAIVAAWNHLRQGNNHELWVACISNLLNAKQQHVNGASLNFRKWQNNDPAVTENPLKTLGLIP